LAKLPVLCFQNPTLIVFQLVKLHIHLTIQCLLYLFLLVLRLLVGQVPSRLGHRAPRDHVNHMSWLSVAKAMSLDSCRRAVNVDSPSQSSYPPSPPKDRDSNPHGLPSRMHRNALRDPQIPPDGKHKFGITCPGALFMETAPGPLKLEK
jgi:hypothetical protein